MTCKRVFSMEIELYAKQGNHYRDLGDICDPLILSM